MALRFGVIALGRPTFDVPYAEERTAAALAAMVRAGIDIVGDARLAYDASAARSALAHIEAAGKVDVLLLLQTTFTDAAMTVELARSSPARLALWGFPEPRIGGRLRLNAFCGLNLAAHALGRAGIAAQWLFAAPEAVSAEGLLALARRGISAPSLAAPPTEPIDRPASDRLLSALRGARFTMLGDHPAGFDTCEHDPDVLARLGDFEVERRELAELFSRASAAPMAKVAAARTAAERDIVGLETVDQTQLEKSFRVFCALDDIQRETGARGLAVRCWPEMFTEYGCAACGPMAMMNAQMTPSACEADIHGSLSQLILQELAGEPAWMADLVDIDAADDTGVFWHCGLAPLSMRDPEHVAEAQIHTNRRMPLLHQFSLKPGRITLLRLSRARGGLMLAIGGAEVMRRPRPFTGCCGVARFDRPASEVADRIVAQGLEHHYAIAYGDHRAALRGVAERWALPVLELC